MEAVGVAVGAQKYAVLRQGGGFLRQKGQIDAQVGPQGLQAVLHVFREGTALRGQLLSSGQPEGGVLKITEIQRLQDRRGVPAAAVAQERAVGRLAAVGGRHIALHVEAVGTGLRQLPAQLPADGQVQRHRSLSPGGDGDGAGTGDSDAGGDVPGRHPAVPYAVLLCVIVGKGLDLQGDIEGLAGEVAQGDGKGKAPLAALP